MSNPAVGIHLINTAQISANTYTTASGTSAASGSSFIIVAAANKSTGCTASDNMGNTYAKPVFGSGANPIAETNDGQYLWAFLATNGTGGAGHTFTFNGNSDTVFAVTAVEITSASTATPIDVSASAYSASTPLSNPVTPGTAGELVLAFGYCGGHTNQPISPSGSGFTTLDQYWAATIDFASLGSAQLANATTASHDPGMQNISGAIAGITIAFALSGGPPPPSTNPALLYNRRYVPFPF